MYYATNTKTEGGIYTELVFQDNVPIYLQIISEIKRRVVAGEWRLGERVPPVRELAQSFGVNPNTMQRALAELERAGLLYTERTAGRYVTKDAGRVGFIRDQMAQEAVREFIAEMIKLGYQKDGILSKLSKELEEGAT